MALFLFVFVPLCWPLFGKVLGWALAAAMFYNSAGHRLGQRISRWCMPCFPAVFLFLMLAGVSGNAGHGFTLFGSATFFELACAIPIYGTFSLGIFAGFLYVIRDLTLGHATNPRESKP